MYNRLINGKCSYMDQWKYENYSIIMKNKLISTKSERPFTKVWGRYSFLFWRRSMSGNKTQSVIGDVANVIDLISTKSERP